VQTAGVTQIRQPIYRSSMARLLPYRDLVRPPLEALELPFAVLP